MNTATKLAAYLVGLAVLFAAAVGVGRAAGPVGPAAEPGPPAVQTGTGGTGMDMDRTTGDG